MVHLPLQCLLGVSLLLTAATPAPAHTLPARVVGVGRLVGTVWVVSPDMPCRDSPDCPKTLDAGLAQLTVGLAWHYKKYGREQDPQQRGEHVFAEEEARGIKVGLWSDMSLVPP
jgi:endonuclease YncB( thermonuclease family)